MLSSLDCVCACVGRTSPRRSEAGAGAGPAGPAGPGAEGAAYAFDRDERDDIYGEQYAPYSR